VVSKAKKYAPHKLDCGAPLLHHHGMLHLHKIHHGECLTYFDDPFIGSSPARLWWGKLANEISLPDEPDQSSLATLLSAGHMGKRHRGGAGKPLVALQMTFSAPKSVSLAGVLFDDQRVITAHRYAVQTCLAHIEDNLLFCRLTSHGHTVQVPSRGALIALFNRFHSRSHDPHLHTHALLMNSGMTEPGRWRAIDQRHLFEEGHLLGDLYQSTLALCLAAYGYQVNFLVNGLIDIGDIPNGLSARFSGRRDQIRDKVKRVTGKELETLSEAGKEQFSLNTAPRRASISIERLRHRWMSGLSATERAFTPPKTRSQNIEWNSREDANEAMLQAYEDLRRPSGGVKRADLLRHVYAASVGRFSMLDLLATFEDITCGHLNVDGMPATLYDDRAMADRVAREEDECDARQAEHEVSEQLATESRNAAPLPTKSRRLSAPT